MFRGERSYLLSTPLSIALLIVCSPVPPLPRIVLQERGTQRSPVIITQMWERHRWRCCHNRSPLEDVFCTIVNLMCKNTGLLFCLNVLDYFIFYFAYFLHINTGQQQSGGFWKEAHGRPVGHTQFEACVKISSVPKGGVVGFPNTVVQWDPSDALLSPLFLPHTALRFLLSHLLLVISYYAYRPFNILRSGNRSNTRWSGLVRHVRGRWMKMAWTVERMKGTLGKIFQNNC